MTTLQELREKVHTLKDFLELNCYLISARRGTPFNPIPPPQECYSITTFIYESYIIYTKKNTGLTRVAKVDDKTAMIQIFDVDMQKMSEALNNPNAATAAATDDHVVKREVFKLEPMAPPS